MLTTATPRTAATIVQSEMKTTACTPSLATAPDSSVCPPVNHIAIKRSGAAAFQTATPLRLTGGFESRARR